MKNFICILIMIPVFAACTRPVPQNKKSSNSDVDTVYNDSQTSKLIYKPGLGELMNRVQVSHSKLWFAGIYRNWKLAEYEIRELRGTFNTISELQQGRKEVTEIPSIHSYIDSVASAVKHRNLNHFKSSYQSLTRKCNACHKATNSAFTVIKTPATPPVTNQEFKNLQ